MGVMRILRHLSKPGIWTIQSDYASNFLYNQSRTIPGLNRVSSREYEGYSDALELAVAYLSAAGLNFDDSAFVTRTPHKLRYEGLRLYQNEAVAHLLQYGESGALLADSMGLGKTAVALSAAKRIGGKTLVICPSYVRGVWWNGATGGEIRKWWPEIEGDVCLPEGVKALKGWRGNPSITVIHPDILYAWVEQIKEWGPEVVIFDEIHMFSSEKTRQSKAAAEIAKGCKIRWGLSGTPLTNRPRDLHNVVELLSPGRFGNFFAFCLRYTNAHQKDVGEGPLKKTVWDFNGRSNLDELNGRLSHFMLRRTVEDVGLELPPKTRQTIWVDVRAKGAICTTENKRALREALDRSADAKMPAALQLVLDHGKAGGKVAVACWRRHVAEYIEENCRREGLQTGLLHGGVSSKVRGKTIERAREAKGGFILCTTIDATQSGIDLTFCNVGVFVELTYEPHEILQWEARFHRPGQTLPVLIQFVIGKGTSDELIAKAVVDKLDVFGKAIGKTAGAPLQESLTLSTEGALAEIYATIAEMQG